MNSNAQHETIGHIDGEWTKFYCPECKRNIWFHEDGRMNAWDGDSLVQHYGSIGGLKIKPEGLTVTK